MELEGVQLNNTNSSGTDKDNAILLGIHQFRIALPLAIVFCIEVFHQILGVPPPVPVQANEGHIQNLLVVAPGETLCFYGTKLKRIVSAIIDIIFLNSILAIIPEDWRLKKSLAENTYNFYMCAFDWSYVCPPYMFFKALVVILVFWLVIIFFYETILLYCFGCTPGKLMMNLRVAGIEGQPRIIDPNTGLMSVKMTRLTFHQVARRTLEKFFLHNVIGLPMSLILGYISLDANQATFYDRHSATLVVELI